MVRPQLSESKAAARLEQTLQSNMPYENGDNSSSERIDGTNSNNFYFSKITRIKIAISIHFCLRDFSSFYILNFELQMCITVCAQHFSY